MHIVAPFEINRSLPRVLPVPLRRWQIHAHRQPGVSDAATGPLERLPPLARRLPPGLPSR